MAILPYVASPGNISKALEAIKKAATPSKVTQDFVKTVLKISGGSGNQMNAYLKKIGFAGTDGSPTDLYTKFRNPTTSGTAAASAIKIAYAPLYKRNEYMHLLNDKELKGLVVEETGKEHNSKVVTLVVSSIKQLKKFADFSEKDDIHDSEPRQSEKKTRENQNRGDEAKPPNQIGLNLGYTININLPATKDPDVFNAIFKSLKQNLLDNEDG